MRIWILSNQKKDELYSTKRFREEAPNYDIDLTVVAPEEVDIIVNREDKKSIRVRGETVELPDILIPRMGASTSYFALAVIRQLERLGVTCINSSLGIETVKDKLFSHQILAQANIPVPKTMLVKFPVDIDLVKKVLGFPIVVKTLSGSQGSGVFLAPDQSTFTNLMELIEGTAPKANIILQEFISQSHGKDLRIFIVGGRIIGCMERKAADGGFKANFSAGGTTSQFELTPNIEWLSLQTAHILGLDVAGIDLLFDGEDSYKVCEANSSPGFKGLEQACNVDVPQEIFKYCYLRNGKWF